MSFHYDKENLGYFKRTESLIELNLMAIILKIYPRFNFEGKGIF